MAKEKENETITDEKKKENQKKKAIKVNPKAMTITIDKSVKLTSDDENLITRYIKGGYTLRYKSEKRVEIARERAKKTGFGKKNKKAENKE